MVRVWSSTVRVMMMVYETDEESNGFELARVNGCMDLHGQRAKLNEVSDEWLTPSRLAAPRVYVKGGAHRPSPAGPVKA